MLNKGMLSSVIKKVELTFNTLVAAHNKEKDCFRLLAHRLLDTGLADLGDEAIANNFDSKIDPEEFTSLPAWTAKGHDSFGLAEVGMSLDINIKGRKECNIYMVPYSFVKDNETSTSAGASTRENS